MKLKSKKSALLLSFTSLLLCFAMLAGSTFAWFTDTATTGVNKIVAGNLDVELLMYKKANGESDYVNISKEPAPIFGSENSTVAQNNNLDTLWEPGKTQVAYLAIKNEGNLDLKYQVTLNVTNPADGKELYQVMQYAIAPNAKGTDLVLPEWTTGSSVIPGAQIVSGTNTTGADPAGVKLLQGETHYFALLVHMDGNAGNKYQNGKVEFDLTVYATQLNSENDSFGPDYDEDAQYPEIVSDVNSLKEAITAGKASVILAKDVTVEDGIQISVTKDVAIDFNGKTLKGTLESGSISSSDPSNNLVLSDPNNDGSYSIDGHIVHHEGGGMTQIAAIAAWKPTVTVESGRYTHDNAVVLCQIQTSEPATGVVINGGVFDGQGAASVIADFIGDVVINNGTFNAHHSDGGNSGECVYLSSGSRGVPTITTINGGVFNASKRVFFVEANTGYTQKIIVNSGSFNVEQDGQLIEVSSGNASDYLTINGGTFNVDPSAYVPQDHTVTDNGNGTWTVR